MTEQMSQFDENFDDPFGEVAEVRPYSPRRRELVELLKHRVERMLFYSYKSFKTGVYCPHDKRFCSDEWLSFTHLSILIGEPAAGDAIHAVEDECRERWKVEPEAWHAFLHGSAEDWDKYSAAGGKVPGDDADVESAARIHGFHGRVTLNPVRAGTDAGKIADEVISHLAYLANADVTVTLEVSATLPDGASDDVVRTVTENCRTFKFESQGFERE
jgi:hypothetical protein